MIYICSIYYIFRADNIGGRFEKIVKLHSRLSLLLQFFPLKSYKFGRTHANILHEKIDGVNGKK